MKTFKELKKLIGFCQTDDFFLEYIQRLSDSDVVKICNGDILKEVGMVSDDFYRQIAEVFGISLNDELQQ